MKTNDVKKTINDILDHFKESNLSSYEARRVLSERIASDICDLIKSEIGISIERPADFLTHLPGFDKGKPLDPANQYYYLDEGGEPYCSD